MSKLWRAALISAVATGAAAAGWIVLARWIKNAVHVAEGVVGLPSHRSREEIVDELSDDHKQQLLDELNQHV